MGGLVLAARQWKKRIQVFLPGQKATRILGRTCGGLCHSSRDSVVVDMKKPTVMTDSTEGMSWPDTLRWLAEHDGEETEKRHEMQNTWSPWERGGVYEDYVYRLAKRKLRRCTGVIDYGDKGCNIDAVEYREGMVILSRMPTDKDLNIPWRSKEDYRLAIRSLLQSLRLEVEE